MARFFIFSVFVNVISLFDEYIISIYTEAFVKKDAIERPFQKDRCIMFVPGVILRGVQSAFL